jgi:hypothetical protein
VEWPSHSYCDIICVFATPLNAVDGVSTLAIARCCYLPQVAIVATVELRFNCPWGSLVGWHWRPRILK